MVKMSDDNVRKIVNFLKNNPDGLTITEITSEARISRGTVRIALANLEGSNRVFVREIGMAKLYSLNGGYE